MGEVAASVERQANHALVPEGSAQLFPVGLGEVIDALGVVRSQERLLDPVGEDRPERHEVGVDARVRLHIGVIGVEQRLGVVSGERLDLVDELASGVVAHVGRALGVLVAEPVAHGEQHGGRCVVLAGDQLELAALIPKFSANVVGHVWLDCGDHVERSPVGGGFLRIDSREIRLGVLHRHGGERSDFIRRWRRRSGHFASTGRHGLMTRRSRLPK